MRYISLFRCALPGLTNDTYQIQSQGHEALVSSLVPNNTEDVDTLGPYDRCVLYRHAGDHDNDTFHCDRWVYDKSMYTNTAIVEVGVVEGGEYVMGRLWTGVSS